MKAECSDWINSGQFGPLVQIGFRKSFAGQSGKILWHLSSLSENEIKYDCKIKRKSYINLFMSHFQNTEAFHAVVIPLSLDMLQHCYDSSINKARDELCSISGCWNWLTREIHLQQESYYCLSVWATSLYKSTGIPGTTVLIRKKLFIFTAILWTHYSRFQKSTASHQSRMSH